MNNRNNSIHSQLEALGQKSMEELKDKFYDLFGFQNRGRSRDGIIRRIAYRLQEYQIGSLDSNTRAILDEMADADPMANLVYVPHRTQAGSSGNRRARYIKSWHGNVHEVIKHARKSFEYNGKFYTSLTAVATAITGTKWNGNKFFGVNKNDKQGKK